MKTSFKLLLFSFLILFFACSKQEGELPDSKINSPFYPDLELEIVDSMSFGFTPDNIFFHPVLLNYAGNKSYKFMYASGILYAVDLDQFEIVWQTDLSGVFSNARKFRTIYDHGDQLALGDYFGLVLINSSTGAIESHFNFSQIASVSNSKLSGYTYLDGTVYLVLTGGGHRASSFTLYAFDLVKQESKELYQFKDGVFSASGGFEIMVPDSKDQLIVPIAGGDNRPSGLYTVIYNIQSQEAEEIFIPEANLRSINYSEPINYKDDMLITSSFSNADVWDLKSRRKIGTIGSRYTIERDYIVTWFSEYGGGIRVFNIHTLQPAWPIEKPHAGKFSRSPAVHPKLSLIAAPQSGDLAIIDIQDGRLLSRHKLEEIPSFISLTFFSSDGNLIYVVNNRGHLKAFQWPFLTK